MTECLACRGSQDLPLPAWSRRCRSPDSVEVLIQRPKIAPVGVETIQEISVVLELRSLDQLFLARFRQLRSLKALPNAVKNPNKLEESRFQERSIHS